MSNEAVADMRKPLIRQPIAIHWLTCFLILGGLWNADRGASCAEGGQKVAESWELFTSTNIARIQIQISSNGMQQLRTRGWSWGWGGARERPEVRATIIEGGQVYTNVALHLKGAAGSFQPLDSKPSMTLNFDKYAPGQTFHGIEKISLNNSGQDPSYLTEKICRELFTAAGVPAPRADYAVVELNGRKLGLYVLLEGYNRQFLRRHFTNWKGNLFDGGFLKDIDAKLNTNSGDPEDQSSLQAVVAAANEGEDSDRFSRLEKVVDMDRFITFLAMEVMVCHWDGYAMNKNNYRVYHDPQSNRVVFMPHGMDQMFGVMMVEPNLPVLRPSMQGLAAQALMETPEGRRRYYQRLAELNETYFNLEALTNRIFQTAARINPLLAEISPASAANHDAAVENLVDRMTQRKHHLHEQLSGARGKILEFDTAGVAPLSGWTALVNAGRPQVNLAPNREGQPILHIGAAQGASVASWRTKVLLEEGFYRFEGRMQIKDVAADPRDRKAGAGLRVSEKPSLRKQLGSAGWNEVAFDFAVPDGIHPVELVCELRASQGEVWFDGNSLRLVRK